MKTRYTVALSLLAGIGLGAIAVQGLHAQTKSIPTYYVAEVEVTNLDGYMKEFLPREQANIKAFGGHILAAGAKVATVDGDPPKPRVVLLAWDGVENFQAWRNAPQTREIRAVGDKHARFRSFAVEGLPLSP